MPNVIVPRKRLLRAHGKKVVFARGYNESGEHVLMKALLWALYLPQYPDLTVEIRIGDRYKPDVVSLNEQGQPRFWGEAGQVSVQKIRSLARRYPDTHFAMGKWDTNLEPVIEIVKEALERTTRHAPFDVLRFPPDSGVRFIDSDGNVSVSHEDLKWIRL
jgi:hypothetical protein